MKISFQDIDDITVLAVDGMITLGSDTKFAQAFQDLLSRNRNKVVLDMTKVKYIDSIGIGQLAGGYTMLNDAGGQLVLARTNEKVQTLLKITGLQSTIQTYPTVSEAIQAM